MRHLKLAIAALMTIQSAYAQVAQMTPPKQIKINVASPQPKQDGLKVYSSPDKTLMRINSASQTAKIEARKRLNAQQSAILQRLIEGPGSTGGGNLNSMAVLSMIKSLKDVLLAKGLDNFPEIAMNWDRFTEKINSRILIKEKHPIEINGEKKVAQFHQSTNTIYFSVPELAKVVNEPNALLRVQAILLHEVLGLIGLEGDTDYNISYRLLGLAMLENLGTKGSKNQIYPADPRDAQVIYWSKDYDGRLTFIYCKNRDRMNTCHQLGGRSYSQNELLNAYKKMEKYYNDNMTTSNNARAFTLTGIGIFAVTWILVTLSPAALFLLVPAIILHLGGSFTSDISSRRAKWVEEMVLTSKEVSLLKPGPTKMNLEEMAAGIDKFLRSVDKTSNSVQRLN